MIKLYKDGRECMAELSQIDTMVAGGWSHEKETPKPKVAKKPVAAKKVVEKKAISSED
jgi:hypothetical protein